MPPYSCAECGCEIDESLLLGYEDPTIGLCKPCRAELLAIWWCEDHPDECEDLEVR
jgi:hypothetical protein